MNEANFNLEGMKIETAKDRSERLKSLDMKTLGAEIFAGDGTAMDMVKAEALVEDLIEYGIDASGFSENVRIVLGKIAHDMLEGGEESDEKQQLREFLVSINMEGDAAVIENQWGEVQKRVQKEGVQDLADKDIEMLDDPLTGEIQDGEILEMGPDEEDGEVQDITEHAELLDYDNDPSLTIDAEDLPAANTLQRDDLDGWSDSGEEPPGAFEPADSGTEYSPVAAEFNAESAQEIPRDGFADFVAEYMLGGREIGSLRFEDLPIGEDGRVQISSEALTSMLSQMERSGDTLDDVNPEVRSLILHAVEDDNSLLVNADDKVEDIRASIKKLSTVKSSRISIPKSRKQVPVKHNKAPEEPESSEDAPDAVAEWEDEELDESMKSAIDAFASSLNADSRVQKTDLSNLVRGDDREIRPSAGAYLASKMNEVGITKDQLTAGALAILKKFGWEAAPSDLPVDDMRGDDIGVRIGTFEEERARLGVQNAQVESGGYTVKMPAAERDAIEDLELTETEKAFFAGGEGRDYASDAVLDKIDNAAIDRAEAEQMARDAEVYLAAREGVIDIEPDGRGASEILLSKDFAGTKDLIERAIQSNYAGYYDTAKDFASDHTMALDYPFTPEGYAQILVDIEEKAAIADKITDAVESQGLLAKLSGIFSGKNARNMANAERLSIELAQLKELKRKYDTVLEQQKLLDRQSQPVKGLRGRVARTPAARKPLKGVM